MCHTAYGRHTDGLARATCRPTDMFGRHVVYLAVLAISRRRTSRIKRSLDVDTRELLRDGIVVGDVVIADADRTRDRQRAAVRLERLQVQPACRYLVVVTEQAKRRAQARAGQTRAGDCEHGVVVAADLGGGVRGAEGCHRVTGASHIEGAVETADCVGAVAFPDVDR